LELTEVRPLAVSNQTTSVVTECDGVSIDDDVINESESDFDESLTSSSGVNNEKLRSVKGILKRNNGSGLSGGCTNDVISIVVSNVNSDSYVDTEESILIAEHHYPIGAARIEVIDVEV
jgi:hypothetical protein